MEGRHVVWLGSDEALAAEWTDALEERGAWVSRVRDVGALEHRIATSGRSIDAVVVEADKDLDAKHTSELVASVHRRCPRATIVLLWRRPDPPPEPAERVLVRSINDPLDATLAALVEGPRAGQREDVRAAVVTALRQTVHASVRPLPRQLRAIVLLRILRLVGHDAADLLRIELNTAQGYATAARDRLGWPSLDRATWVFLRTMVDDIEAVLAEVLEDPELAGRIVKKLEPAVREGLPIESAR